MTLRTVGWNIALAVAAFLMAWVPAALSLPSGSLNDVIWPMAGLVLGCLLLWGPRAMVPLMVGEFAVCLVVGIPFFQSLWVISWEVLSWGWIGAWLLRRYGRYCEGFESMASVLGLIALQLGLCLFLRVSLGTFFRLWFGWTTWTKCWWDVGPIWLSCIAGILIVAPLMLGLARYLRAGKTMSRPRWAEAAVLALGLVLTSYFLVPTTLVTSFLPVTPFLLFPFFIWAALRFSVLGVGVSSLLFAVSSFERFFFSGFLAEPQHMQAAMIYYQTLLVVSSITGLLVAGALADRRQAVETLESTVADRTIELRAANEGKDKLLAIIGHDMRAPLFGLVKLSEFLAESSGQIKPEKLAAYAGEMHQSAKGQLETLENLLSWARLRSGQAIYRPEHQFVDALVEPVVNLFKLRANLREISLESRLAREQLVTVDLEMTRSILRNLLSNALHASQAGGRILLEAKREGDEVLIAVSDQGSGLSAEEVEAHLTGKEASSPGGLGLLLVREFCAAQGSSLTIESQPGRGTRMTFRLDAV